MSTLTKIFVVLLVVFSIAFTSMTISIVAQTTNWRETAEKYKQHALIADTNLRHQIAACAATEATANEKLRDQLEKINALEVQLQASRNEAAQIRAQLAKLESEKSSAEAINRGLLGQLQVAETARAEYRKQRDELERRNIDLERRNLDLSDRVNELTATTAVLVEQKRQYEQQINILKMENEKLARQARAPSAGGALEKPEGIALPGVYAISPVARSAIRGSVVEVSGDLVTISVGSADGVKQGMVFVIHREDQYVGDLRISVVEPNQSAGRIVRSALTTQPGDKATDEASLSASRG